MQNNPKKILLCVCGSIAAYKTPEIIRILQEQQIEVQVAMSEAAQKFITPLSLETISKRKVILSHFQANKEGKINHIEATQKIDMIVVAPATGNILSKFVCGFGDDLISTILLAANVPIVFAPAMNDKMWESKIIQKNIEKAKELGALILDTQIGLLACGSYGIGKMLTPEKIVEFIVNYGRKKIFENNLSNKKVLISLGATKEYLDPFRFISNDSSGKMGLAIANAFLAYTKEIFLVCANTSVSIPSNFEKVFVTTTEQMAKKVIKKAKYFDIIVMCAAVSDYKLAKDQKSKIKDQSIQLTLDKTVDILFELGKKKRKGQVLVGFAAETKKIQTYAIEKIEKKNLDFIYANKIGSKKSGFGSDNSNFQIISKETINKTKIVSKENAAKELVSCINQYFQKKN